MPDAPSAHQLRRARWRADHRGIREADMLVGGFADRYLAQMTAEELAWFEDLMEEQDVDIIAWATGATPVPPRYAGAMMENMRKLDYIRSPEG